jgi:hypothetical protein
LGENFDLSDGEGESSEGGSDDGAAVTAANALEARRQAAAAGDHPLQQAFRDAAARLAAKHGVEVPQQEDHSEDEGEDEGEDGSEGEREEGSEGDSDAELGSEQQEGAEEGSGSEEGSESEQPESESADADNDQQQQQEEQVPHPTKALKQQQRQQQQEPSSKAAAVELEGPLDLSFTPAVPETYQEFVGLVGGRPAGQLLLAIQRIRTFNKAALATDSKRKLQASGLGE